MTEPETPVPPPVVEPKPQGEGPDVPARELWQRIRQQEILAELGVSALHGAGFDQLLDDAARLAAEGLRAEFSKVLEFIPAENRFLVRAGVGWEPGVVGVATVGADVASPAGFALKTGKSVISNHLENEERFRTPAILVRHGVHRAMNVILQGDGLPYGVLEVDSGSEDSFVEQDLSFLQGAANILGMAIERKRYERNLETALQRHQFLIREMNHRVKNSLGIVASLLRLQARDLDDGELLPHLEEAAARVGAIARAHDLLFQTPDLERLDVGRYIASVCKELDASFAISEIRTDAESGIVISADRAISAALIVNELVASAVKHAQPGREVGQIWVRVVSIGGERFSISVRGDGLELPPGFQPGKTKALGMRIVTALIEQLGGTLTFSALESGTEFVVTAPRNLPA
jgi:two-component sensor histidine kinase